MIRLLSAMLALLLLGGGISAASSPTAFDDLAKRISALELQAQNKGLPLPPMPIPERGDRLEVAQSSAGLAVRVDRLEAQMRQYNGQIEELNFHIRQLQEQLRRFQEDSEFRFQDLEKGNGRKSGSLSAPSNSKPSPKTFEQLGTPPQTLGSLSEEQLLSNDGLVNDGLSNDGLASGTLGAEQPAAGPIDLSSMLGGATVAPSSEPSLAQPSSLTGDPATDYDLAYSEILKGNYPAAEQAFRQFVQAYPQDRLTPNAHYWIGESRYQQGDFPGAIEVFLDAYSQFPNAQKSPDMLLKTGMSLRQIKERDAACATYEELLQKFPNASTGIRQKVRSEIKSAQC